MKESNILPVLIGILLCFHSPLCRGEGESPPSVVGTRFENIPGLHESGWRNFLGSRTGRLRVVSQKLAPAGNPSLPSAEFAVSSQDATDWYAGLFLPVPELANLDPETLSLRATVTMKQAGVLTVRLESSPGNWMGFQVDVPQGGEWVRLDRSLREGEVHGKFNPSSETLRMVIAFVPGPGPTVDQTMYIHEAHVVTLP